MSFSYHDEFALDFTRSLQTIVILPLAQRRAVNVRREIAHGGLDPLVERTAEGQMPTETHARGADAAVARRQREEVVDRQGGILVVGGQFLFRSAASTVNAKRGERPS